MIKIAVFASGEGTNLQALIDATRSGRIRGQLVLVVSNREEAGALRRAQRAGIPTLLTRAADHPSTDAYDAHLATECRRAGVDLVCLAGYLLKLGEPMLRAYPERILNIHPALLPAFGGKGMYGMRVHEAVLSAGATVSGCTVHFADAAYDHGPILAQAAVPVLPNDTAATLAARVRRQEHWIYPEAVRLVAEGRIRIRSGRVAILRAPDAGSNRVKRALLSMSDKTGLVEFAKGLEGLGVELVSTSGTAKALRDAGLEVRPLDSMTGYPEILNGRVKTLHPRIHGGILLRRSDPAQADEAAALGLEPIDLVAVNLYPFEAAAAASPSPYSHEAIENIDIGGVTLIRAAAKNFEDVAVVVSPSDYAAVLSELSARSGQLALETRRRLALAAYAHTAAYDAMITRAWSQAPSPAGRSGALPEAPPKDPSAPLPEPAEREGFPSRMSVGLQKVQDLRYGENPHQKAALYTRGAKGAPPFKQLQGKELSYNNLLDAYGTWEAVSEFREPAAVIFKHVTPSGMAIGSTLLEAFSAAWACDPLSAFGGVLAFNRPLTRDIAELLAKRFVEVLVAPGFEAEALALLQKKPNLRLLAWTEPPPRTPQLRSLGDEVLVTDPDRLTFGPEWKVATRRAPTKAEEAALGFAWIAAKHVKSNAIVLAGPTATVGIGAGQMSRVDSVHMASVKYKLYREDNPAPGALVLASDAFFPFRDGVDAAATTGATAIIQPGGSVKDAEVIAAADAHGLAMVLTGMRHFRH